MQGLLNYISQHIVLTKVTFEDLQYNQQYVSIQITCIQHKMETCSLFIGMHRHFCNKVTDESANL